MGNPNPGWWSTWGHVIVFYVVIILVVVGFFVQPTGEDSPGEYLERLEAREANRR